MCKILEEVFAFHCAPTLAGIKPASLVACSLKETPGLIRELKHYNHVLNPKGIVLELLCKCETRALVLVYRADMLASALQQPACKSFLQAEGYSRFELSHMLSQLKERLTCDSFPHEIGMFLGYPLEDVVGFIQNRGRNFKLCGYWKVYQNEDVARRMFQQYTRCREEYTKRVKIGIPISQLCVA